MLKIVANFVAGLSIQCRQFAGARFPSKCVSVFPVSKTKVRWELFSAHVLMRHLAQSCAAVPPIVGIISTKQVPFCPTQAISTGNKTSYGKKICRRIHWLLLGLNGARQEVKAYCEPGWPPESCDSTQN